jgi:hypothetical protein
LSPAGLAHSDKRFNTGGETPRTRLAMPIIFDRLALLTRRIHRLSERKDFAARASGSGSATTSVATDRSTS